jgi:hypothetical protein
VCVMRGGFTADSAQVQLNKQQSFRALSLKKDPEWSLGPKAGS